MCNNSQSGNTKWEIAADTNNCFYQEKKEMFYLTTHILFTVMWRRTYGKGPLR